MGYNPTPVSKMLSLLKTNTQTHTGQSKSTQMHPVKVDGGHPWFCERVKNKIKLWWVKLIKCIPNVYIVWPYIISQSCFNWVTWYWCWPSLPATHLGFLCLLISFASPTRPNLKWKETQKGKPKVGCYLSAIRPKLDLFIFLKT